MATLVFYPKAEKGVALGFNAGLGNLGVSGMQLIAPLVIGTSVFGPISGDPRRLAGGGRFGGKIGVGLFAQSASVIADGSE